MLFNLRITPAQLKTLSEWAVDLDDSANVLVRREDDWIYANQGDDHAAITPNGRLVEEG